MNVGIIITMGAISVVSAVTEKVLISLGKSDEAQFAKIAGMSAVGISALTCVIEIFNQLNKFKGM